MTKIATALAVLVATPFPAGTVAGDLVFELRDTAGNVVDTKRGAGASVEFDAVQPGTYVVAAYRADSAGLALSPAVVSELFTVEDGPTTVSIDVPASVTVTLA